MSDIKQASNLMAAIMNPLLNSTIHVFDTMLGCKPSRKGMTVKNDLYPLHDLSAVIGVTGKIDGTFVMSLPEPTALKIYDRMLGVESTEINREVRDAVGEITNMIAGSAKAKLAQFELSISIPNMIAGRGHEVHYPTGIQPICLFFESELGEFCVESGFALASAPV